MRYGQNQNILIPTLAVTERLSWKRDHRYHHIKHFTFLIATHISFLDVKEWKDLPRAEVAACHPQAYNDYNIETRNPVNLRRIAMENIDGDPINVYDKEGFRVIRQKITRFSPTSMLMDLSLAHVLFQTELDDFGHVRNNIKYTVYPLAFTRNLGNIQADGVITLFSRRMNMIDAKLCNALNQQGHQHCCRLANSDMNSDSNTSNNEQSFDNQTFQMFAKHWLFIS